MNAEHETLVWQGGEVKALNDEGKVGGYLVLFSTANDPDLASDFFTAKTDFGDATKSTILYHHGLDSTIKATKLGAGSLKVDEVGVWIEGQLELRDEYEKAIFELAKKGKLGWSSGTASHLVSRKSVGKSFEITSWPLGLDASLTPTPCEPRTSAIPLKSISVEDLPNLKGASLTQAVREIDQAVWHQLDGWVVEAFDDEVIVGIRENYYTISYTKQDGEIVFAPMNEWVQVEEERNWVAKKSAFLKRFAELNSSQVEAQQVSAQDTTGPTEAKSKAAEHIDPETDLSTVKTMNEQIEKVEDQEEKPVNPTTPATEAKAAPVEATSHLTITRAEYDQFQQLQVQAKAFSQEPKRIVKAAHDISAPAINTTGLGDDETKAIGHWIKTGDWGAVPSSMKTVNGTGQQVLSIKASNNTDMNVGTAADGGNAVPTGHYQNIIARRDEMMLANRLGVQEIPGVGTTVNVPVDAEDDGEFIATSEAAANDRDAPALGSVAMTLAKYTKRVELSDELLQDEDSRLMAFLENFISRGMAKTHNDLLITEVETSGTNLKTFAGAAAIAAGEIQDITFNDNLAYYLDDSSSVAWVTRPSTYGSIASIQGDSFVYDSTPQGSSAPSNGAKGSLAMYPVHFSNKVETLATGNKSILFGNWFYVGVRNAPEFQVLRDPYSAATTGQLRLHYYFRTVYKVLQAEAIGYGTQA